MKSSARKLILSERELEVVKLRKAGATLEQIAVKLQCSISTVHRTLTRALESYALRASEETAGLRAFHVEMLEELKVPFWTAAKQGDHIALDAILKIEDRVYRLLGLEAAQRIEVVVREVHAFYSGVIAEVLADDPSAWAKVIKALDTRTPRSGAVN